MTLGYWLTLPMLALIYLWPGLLIAQLMLAVARLATGAPALWIVALPSAILGLLVLYMFALRLVSG